MMDEINAHLIANLSLIGIFWAIILLCVWTFLTVGVILKTVLSLIGLVVSGYIGHRLFPKVTGPIIEKLYQREH
jgi:hypothetical protein